jgi:hypothetical protein
MFAPSEIAGIDEGESREGRGDEKIEGGIFEAWSKGEDYR